MGTFVDLRVLLERMLRSHGTNAARDHNWLVVAPVILRVGVRSVGQQCPEDTSQGRAAELRADQSAKASYESY